MPYLLSPKGYNLATAAPSYLQHLTALQKGVLAYMLEHRREGPVESSVIARYYNLAPQAMRGPCASLYQQGLLNKAGE